MTQLEQQMIDELAVAQGFTNDLASNLTTKGVPSSTSEGLDTLVPKVLTIPTGGGTTKTDYELWQEGFGYNWDSVIQNAPMTNTRRILHIYTKVELLKMMSTFPTTIEIYTYNGSVYRQIIMDSNKRLAFIAADYMTNSFDNLQYVCVIYKAASEWGDYYFNTYLPVVYSNSKYSYDSYVNLINIGGGQTFALYPFLRGVDCYSIGNILIGNSLEHLTTQVYGGNIQIVRVAGSDQQARILKDIIDNAPTGTTFMLATGFIETALLYISDEKLADWFYNDFTYNRNTATSYLYGFAVSNVVKKFNINPNMIFKGNSYLSAMPNMVYIEGFIEEDITQTDANAGMCNFRNSGWRMLQNFPMWKVKEGATTGCLLPMKTQTNVANYLNGSFRFYSTNLEPNKFCEFDENGIIEDPTKYFICNLPIETETHANIQVKFEDLTFKNNYTQAQQIDIKAYLSAKKWSLQW